NTAWRSMRVPYSLIADSHHSVCIPPRGGQRSLSRNTRWRNPERGLFFESHLIPDAVSTAVPFQQGDFDRAIRSIRGIIGPSDIITAPPGRTQMMLAPNSPFENAGIAGWL